MSVRKVSMKSARMTTTSTAELKDKLLKWICERHAINGPLDRQLLRDKAIELANSYGVIGFKCSEAWLTVFLKKYGFSPSLTNCNGPIFTDYRVWIDLLRSLITQYRHKDLFNVDELVMYSDFLPSRKTTKISSQQHGDNVTENHEISSICSQTKRIEILLCCNSSGTEKLEPLISNPYTLEKSRNETRHSRHEISSISDDTFNDWLERLNDGLRNSHRNILLLLSRERIRSLHNFQRFTHVKLVFFPKDFPTQLRPLRGDIFHSVKMTYRCRYVEHIRSHETTKEWNTKEIVESVFEAWKDVPQELIVSSFQRTKFREDESILKIHCPVWDSLETGMSFRKFVTFDDELSENSSHRIDEEMNFLSCPNERRYNLRKSRHDTVDLDESGEILSNESSKKVRKIVEGRNRNEILVDRDENLIDRLSNDQGSSRIDEIQDRPDENEESQNSRISGFPDSNDEDKSLENVIDAVSMETIDNRTSMEFDQNYEILNNSTEEIYHNSEGVKALTECCFHATKLPTESLGPEVSSRCGEQDETSDVSFGRRDLIEERGPKRFKMQEERVESLEKFPGDIGASGNRFHEPDETSKDVNSSCVTEFDDEERITVDDELRLKILDAIESCDDIERSSNDYELPVGRNNDNHAESSKRSRTRSGIDEDNFNNEGESTNKRARSDYNWSKRYEKNFVFGPEMQNAKKLVESATNYEKSDKESSVCDRSEMSQTGSEEIEKRCIFTLEGSNNSTNLSYPTTKD